MGGILGGTGYGLFGLAMLSSRHFPRWLGWLGVIGGALMVVGGVFSPFNQAGPTIIFVSFFLNFVWIFISGVFLLRIKVASARSPSALTA
ncbi:MAG: DUF4386 family protein [Chloroflexi bacterium]|nr:DUF4386 family protein [Chloroflexota bacterium]